MLRGKSATHQDGHPYFMQASGTFSEKTTLSTVAPNNMSTPILAHWPGGNIDYPTWVGKSMVSQKLYQANNCGGPCSSPTNPCAKKPDDSYDVIVSQVVDGGKADWFVEGKVTTVAGV